MDTLFLASNLLVIPFWVLMILLPTWRWTGRIMQSPLVTLGPALLYAGLVAPSLFTTLGAVANPSLSAIAALLGTSFGATVAWAHFLAFDLLVGRWAYLDGRQRKIHPLLMSPILFCIFMLGPLGYLLYLLARRSLPVLTTKVVTESQSD